MIVDDVTELIGRTPLIRLKTLRDVQCHVYAKVEAFNAGGSVKDRIALAMITEAENRGILIPGKSIIVEPTSGNTGIGLALVAAVRGYEAIIVMPQKMSREKERVLTLLGAKVVRTPTEAAHDDPESHISVAKKIVNETPNAVMLDQYNNEQNPLAHYNTTGVEILDDLASVQRTCDVLVAGAGTGGTVSGTARRLKEHNPKTVVVAADPEGSVLAESTKLLNTEEHKNALYQVEGIGYDFVPATLHSKWINYWVKTSDDASFKILKEIYKTDAILCGGSSGSALAAAQLYLEKDPDNIAHDSTKTVVVLFPDSIRNYLSKEWLD